MSNLTKLFWILALAAFVIAIHAGFMFGKPIIDHKFFVSDAEELMRYNFKQEEDARERFLMLAKERNIPLNEEGGLEVWRNDGNSYTILVKYSKTVDYYGLYKKKYDYEMEFTK